MMKAILKAANAKAITEQGQSGTLWLNHNAYIYNKAGQRLKNFHGNKKLYWGHSIKYVGKTQPIDIDSKKYYLLNDDNYHQSWLPYRTIKGNQYYSLGKGGYVKAANVGQIDNQPLYISMATVALKSFSGLKEISAINSSQKFKNNQKVTIDRITKIYSGNQLFPYYRLKGTNTFINKGNIINLPRQKFLTYTKSTHVITLGNTDVYNIEGKQRNLNTNPFSKGDNIPVSELLYIWLPDKGKAELFYRLQDLWLEGSRS